LKVKPFVPDKKRPLQLDADDKGFSERKTEAENNCLKNSRIG